MNLGRAAAVAGIAWLLTACSSVKDELKPVKLEALDPSVVFKKEWNRTIGSAQRRGYTRLQPLLDGDVVYTTDPNGKVSALDVAKGRTRWEVRLDTAVGGGVGNGGELLYLGGVNGDVIAVKKEDGSVAWKTGLSSEVMAPPQSDGEIVIAPAIDGRLFALSASDGSRQWSYDHPMPVLTLRGNAAPLLLDDSAYVGFDNGQLLKFDSETGQLRWSTRVAQPEGKTEIERLIDVDTAPVSSGPFVYVAGVNGRLVAINRGTGRINWAQDLSTHHNIALDEGKIAVSTDDSHVRAFDAATGMPLWENKKLHRRNIGPPVILDGLVIVIDHEKFMHGLDLETGELVARRRIAGEVIAQPVAADGIIYVQDTGGQLSAFSLKKKKTRTKAEEKTTEAESEVEES